MTEDLGTPTRPHALTGEQWRLEVRTDDPPSPSADERWIRSDLDSGDRIATLKCGDGTEIPLFATGSAEETVREARRYRVGGQTVYAPLAPVDEAAFPARRVQHDGQTHAFHDRVAPGSAIRDSEANQKLVHRYYYGTTDPFVDQIGNSDGTNNGTTEISGDWVDEAARQGDGTDDYVSHGTLGSFGSGMGASEGFAIAVSFQGTEALAGGPEFMMGQFNDADSTAIQIPGDGASDEAIYIVEAAGTDTGLAWPNHGTYEDDSPHRLVYNIVDPSDTSTWEIWADQSEESVSGRRGSSLGSTTDFEFDFTTFARNLRGDIQSFSNIILDDVCFFGESLTQSEIESYQNPWP